MAPPGDNSKGTAAASGLQADIDSLLDGIGATADRVEQAATEATAPVADADPLQARVDELLADAAPSDPEPVPDPIKAIDSLDAQLAELTAELLETNKPVQPPSIPAPTLAPPTLDQPAPPPPAAPFNSPAPIPPEASALPGIQELPTPPPAADYTPHAPPASPPAPISTAESQSLAGDPPEKEPGPLLRAFAALSSPLQGRSESVRMGVSLVALQTLFIAAGVWAWMYFRPPAAPVHGPQFDLKTGTLPRPARPDSAGTAPEKPAKGDPAKATPATKKAAATAGGGH